jgi:hypothetical protein
MYGVEVSWQSLLEMLEAKTGADATGDTKQCLIFRSRLPTYHAANARNIAGPLDQSGLSLAARITMVHLSVSWAMNLPKSAGDP